MKKLIAVAALALLAGAWLGRSTKAQSVVTTFTGNAPHTACPVLVGQTNFCFASDGLWQSLNGAAYSQLGSGTSGVISVNGKTGIVVLTGTTTIQ